MPYFIAFLFFLYSNSIQAQTYSIPDYILEETDDLVKFELLIQETNDQIDAPFAEQQPLLDLTYSLSLQLDDKIRQYYLLGNLGDLYGSDTTFWDKGIEYYKKAIRLKEIHDLDIAPTIYARLHNALSGVMQNKYSETSIEMSLSEKKALIQEARLHALISVKRDASRNNAWLLLGNANVRMAIITEEEGNEATDHQVKPDLYKKALGYYLEAIQNYEKVQDLRSDHPDVIKNLSIAYRDKGKLLGRRLGRLDESIASLEIAKSYSKKDVDIYRLLGVANGMKGSMKGSEGFKEESVIYHKKAIQYFKKAVDLNPKLVSTLYNLEIAYRHLGDFENAELYRQKWTEIDPDYDPNK